ncbi:hypothetical protein ZHAS_00006183 [Anopheles sinensis]|uniref:Uncharacterized protein n=1 Tax=Anopheles sinensis TaxID=74873 RepID=A0A084VLD0_ANOSI|nr:hypothetical protein ZHAS_00006183 [Anopheles sinensis]
MPVGDRTSVSVLPDRRRSPSMDGSNGCHWSGISDPYVVCGPCGGLWYQQ